jgi:hypothetical protein
MRGPETVAESEARRLRAALINLPEIDPPPVWERIEQRLLYPEEFLAARWPLAASLAAAGIIAVVLWRALPFAPPAEPEPSVAMLEARATTLESALAVLPRSRLARGDTSLAAAQLEERLAEVDAILKADGSALAPRDRQQLWQQRVRLLDSLVCVRYAANAERAL